MLEPERMPFCSLEFMVLSMPEWKQILHDCGPLFRVLANPHEGVLQTVHSLHCGDVEILPVQMHAL